MRAMLGDETAFFETALFTAVKLHLLLCPECRSILATLRALPYLLAELGEEGGEGAEAALGAVRDRAARSVRDAGAAHQHPVERAAKRDRQ